MDEMVFIQINHQSRAAKNEIGKVRGIVIYLPFWSSFLYTR